MPTSRCSTGVPFPLLVVTLAVIACTDAPTRPATLRSAGMARADDAPLDPAVVRVIRDLAVARGMAPVERSARVRPNLVRLGQALLFDPVLSGPRDIACATCHFPTYAMGDAKSLSVGEGGTGLGPDRTHPGGVFIPRNAPAPFDMAYMRHLFWDGRVQLDANGMVSTPAGAAVTPEMQRVFEFGPISALGMFPVTSRSEMRGAAGTSELAAIADDDPTAIWAALMRRLGAIPEYREMFEDAYPGTPFDQMSFAYASNAIGGFLVDRLTFPNAPWDRFLRGDDGALSARQLAGAQTFLTLKCSVCHTGALLSDDQFHDVAVAQLGPGVGDGASGRDDFGRERVTGDPADRYRFRTTPLRNVELTGPYGHDGAFRSLRGFVEHYSESDQKLSAFDPFQIEPALQGTVLANQADILAQRDPLLAGVVLTPEVVDRLMDYMTALTDPSARDLTRLIPRRVPSGLPVDGARP